MAVCDPLADVVQLVKLAPVGLPGAPAIERDRAIGAGTETGSPGRGDAEPGRHGQRVPRCRYPQAAYDAWADGLAHYGIPL